MTGVRLGCVSWTGATERQSPEEDAQGHTQYRELSSDGTGDGEKSQSNGGDQVPGIQIHVAFSDRLL